MKKVKKETVEYIVVGSNFRISETEAGAGKTRFGIKLEMAARIYSNSIDVEVWSPESAKEIAKRAFEATEIFLDEVDKHFLVKPAPEPEVKMNNRN
jgi:hypothetical protein